MALQQSATTTRRTAAGPCLSCTGIRVSVAFMRCPVFFLQTINKAFWAFHPIGIHGQTHRSSPGFFKAFPLIALAWVLDPITGRFQSFAPHFKGTARLALFLS